MNKSYLPIVTPIVLFVSGLGFLGFTYYKNITSKPAALSVTSKYGEASVKMKNKELGNTPIDLIDLRPGLKEIKITTENNEFTKDVVLTEEAYTTISIDVGVSDKFSANQILWYDKSNRETSELFISSTPKESTVKINNKVVGETPLTVSKNDLLETENDEYTIVIEKEGYEAQKLNVKLEPGFTLNVSAQLFLRPIPKNVTAQELNSFYKIYTFSDPLIKNNQQGNWGQAVDYWLKTRGEAIIGTETIEGFDYFIDSEGTLYSGDGKTLDAEKISIEQGESDSLILVGYLSLEDDSTEISTSAQDTLAKITNTEVVVSNKSTYEVTETGVGYLNVRSTPQLDGELLYQLDVGEKVKVIGEDGYWFKVEYKESDSGDTKQAWAYSSYLRKVESEPESEGAE